MNQELILKARERSLQRRHKLRDAGFRNVTKEEKDKVLNNLIRKA